MTIDLPSIAYNQYPGSNDPRLDLGGGDFTIDFDDPLPWGELEVGRGSLRGWFLNVLWTSSSDNGMMWFMDETLSLYATDTQEASTTDTRDTQGSSGLPFEDTRAFSGVGDGDMLTANYLRDTEKEAGGAVTPPIDTSDDDKWRE